MLKPMSAEQYRKLQSDPIMKPRLSAPKSINLQKDKESSSDKPKIGDLNMAKRYAGTSEQWGNKPLADLPVFEAKQNKGLSYGARLGKTVIDGAGNNIVGGLLNGLETKSNEASFDIQNRVEKSKQAEEKLKNGKLSRKELFNAINDKTSASLFDKFAYKMGVRGVSNEEMQKNSLARMHLDKGAQAAADATEGTNGITRGSLELANMGATLVGEKAISTMTGLPFLGTSGLVSGGSAAYDAAKQGADVNKQSLYGTAMGLSNAAIESLGGIGGTQIAAKVGGKLGAKLLPKAVKKAFETTGGKIAKNALEEGAEEALQYEVDRRIGNKILDTNKAYDPREQAVNAMYGGVMGGVFGGARAVGDIHSDAKAEKQAAKQYVSDEMAKGKVIETNFKPQARPLPIANKQKINSPVVDINERFINAEKIASGKLENATANYRNKYAEFRSTDSRTRRPELYDEITVAKESMELAKKEYDGLLQKKANYDNKIAVREQMKVQNEQIKQQNIIKADALGEISERLKARENPLDNRIVNRSDIYQLKKIGENSNDIREIELALDEAEKANATLSSLRRNLDLSDDVSKSIEINRRVKQAEQKLDASANQLEVIQQKYVRILDGRQRTLRGIADKTKIEPSARSSSDFSSVHPVNAMSDSSSSASIFQNDGNIKNYKENKDISHSLVDRLQLPMASDDDVPAINRLSRNTVNINNDFPVIEPSSKIAKPQTLGGGFSNARRDSLIAKNASEADPRELKDAKVLAKEIDYDSDTIIPSEIAWKIDDVNGAYNKDIARVLDAAGKSDTSVRGFLQQNILDPLMQAKSNYAHNVKNTLNKYYNDMKQIGIRAGSTESAAVQWFGEGYKRDKNGQAIEYTLEQLKRDFPDRWQNITKADGINRKLYDDYVDRLNAELERIYPNVEENAQKDLLNFKAKAQVFQKQFSELEQGIEASSGELKTKFEKQMKTLTSSIQENDGEIIKLQRKIESGEIFRNKRVFKRNDYYHHWKEMDKGLSAILNIFDMPAEIAPGLVGVSDFTKPKSKWAGFMQRREGLDSSESAIGGMIRYIQAAEYKINIDPQIARLRVAVRDLQEGTADTRNANKFIEWLTNYTNDLAGKTNPFDRGAQMLIGRKTMKAVKWLNNRVKANAVMGNASSVVSQIYNLPNVVGYIKNPIDLASGIKETAKLSFGDKQAKEAIEQSGFITERYLSNTLNKFDESIIKTPEKFLGWFMEIGDRKVAEMSWFSAYRQAQRKGISDPVSYADDITRRAIAGRGIGEIPLTQKSEVVKLLAPFQIEVNNSYQVLKEKLGQKDALGIISIFGTTWLLNQIRKNYIDGRETGMDMIGAGEDAYKEITTGDSKDYNAFGKAATVAGRLGGEVLSNIPMGDQFVNTVLGLDGNTSKKLFGEGDPTRFGTGNIGISALTKPAANWATGKPVDYLEPIANIGLPYGGAQVTRSRKALEDINVVPKARVSFDEGFTAKKQETAGAYTDDNKRLKYPLDSSDIRNAATGVLFGSLSTNEGKKYLNDGAKMLSETATGQFNDAVKSGIEPFPVFDTIKKFQEIEPIRDQNGNVTQSEPLQKRKDIMLMDLPVFKKTRLDQILVAGKDKDTGEYKRTADYSSDGAFVASTTLNESSFEKAQKAYEMGVPYENYVKVHDALKPLSKAKSAEKRRVIAGLDIPAKQKNIIDDFLINDITIIPKDVKADYSSKETFDISTSSEAAQRKWNYAKKAGFSSDEFKQAWSVIGGQKGKKNRINALIGAGHNSRDAEFLEKLYSVRLK